MKRYFGVVRIASEHIARMYDWERYANARSRLHVKEFELQIEVLKLQMQEYLDIQGVDIFKPDYKKSAKYRKIKKQPWVFVSKKAITVDKFVENYLMGENKTKYAYKSKYNMGSKTDLSEGDCSLEKLGEEIQKILWGPDTYGLQNLIDYLYSYEDVLIKRLKRNLNLAVDISMLYEKEHRQDWFRILYFFYMVESREYPGKDVLAILSTLSMENWDAPFHNFPSNALPTQNRLITRYIKKSFVKELSREMILRIERSLLKITREWTLLLENARTYASVFSEYSLDNGIKEIVSLLEPVPQRLYGKNNNRCQHILTESLYLRILQLEYRGSINDYLGYIRAKPIEEDYSEHQMYLEKIKSETWEQVDVDKIESHIMKHALRLAEYVYLCPETNKEDRRKIRKNRGRVLLLLGFFNKHTNFVFNEANPVHELLIVSCLQVLIIDKRDEMFEYAYCDSASSRRVQGAFKGHMPPTDSLQRYLIRKVMNRWFANLGKLDENNSIHELEHIIYRILDEILRMQNLDEMMEIHDYYVSTLHQKFLIPESLSHNIPKIRQSAQMQMGSFDEMFGHRFTLEQSLITAENISYLTSNFRHYLADLGFEYIDSEHKIRYVFIHFIGQALSLSEAFMEYIEKITAEKETIAPFRFIAYKQKADKNHQGGSEYTFVFEGGSFSRPEGMEPRQVFDFELAFDYGKSTCTMTDFKLSYGEQYKKRMENLGVEILAL